MRWLFYLINNYFCGRKTYFMKSTSLFKSKGTILYQDCNDTTIHIYKEVVIFGRYEALVKKGKAPEKAILVAQMEKINEEFMRLRGQSDTASEYDKITYKEFLEIKVEVCRILITNMKMRLDCGLMTAEKLEKYVGRLKKYGFRLNRDRPLEEELINVVNELKAIQTTIEVLHNEIYPVLDEIDTDMEKSALAFHSMLLTMQRILDIDKIDLKTTTLVELVTLEIAVNQKIKTVGNG